MNREIKFRVWDKKLKEMNLFLNIESGEILFHFSCINKDKKRFEIMQFTGLQDSEGKDIYEGDLVIHSKYGNELFNIEFMYGGFGILFESKHGNEFKFLFDLDNTLMKIKGNIFENGELLYEKDIKEPS